MVKTSNGSAFIIQIFEDTIYLDASLSKIKVIDLALDWLSSNCVVNNNSILLPLTFYTRSLSGFLCLDQHFFIKYSSLLQLKYMFFLFFIIIIIIFCLSRACMEVCSSSDFLLAIYCCFIVVSLLMSSALYSTGLFIIIQMRFEYLNMSMMEKETIAIKSLFVIVVLVTSSSSPVRFKMVVRCLQRSSPSTILVCQNFYVSRRTDCPLFFL